MLSTERGDKDVKEGRIETREKNQRVIIQKEGHQGGIRRDLREAI